MAYKTGDRQQINLFPASIEDYVAVDDPVRAYDAFVDTLDLSQLGIEIDENKVGNSSYAPLSMLKLLVYGYSYGWKSSRKLERALYHNTSFMWLMGGLKPDHKTISLFRKNNLLALKKVLKQCACLCMELDLIEGNTLFVDGTKVRANANRGKNYSKRTYEEKLLVIDTQIEELLKECHQIDEEEDSSGSLVKMKKELCDKENLKSKIARAMQKFEDIGTHTKTGKERTVNQTDPDSALLRSVQGSHASYNVQGVVDDKHGLIVSTDVNDASSDINEFASQINNAEKILGKDCSTAVADAGYADTYELAKIDKRGTTVIVPSVRQSLRKGERPFSKSSFKYDEENNCYYCPQGHRLNYFEKKQHGTKLIYFITNAKICRACRHFGVCTSSSNGRQIVRLSIEAIREKLEQQYQNEKLNQIYRRRKTRSEHPFGHIKHNLGMTNFLVRGNAGAQAEFSLGATCFNVARMITIFGGVQGFISALQN
jgi:transposase